MSIQNTQYNIVQEVSSKRYIMIRTPDYKSSGWSDSINDGMFTHDYDNKPGHFSRYVNENRPIQEMIKKSEKSYELIAIIPNTIRSIKEFQNEYPEFFI